MKSYAKTEKSERLCECCEREFEPKKKWQRFCTPECRSRKWEEMNPRVKLLDTQQK